MAARVKAPLFDIPRCAKATMSDPQKYRTKDEAASYVERDPITHVRNVILENKWNTEEELKAVEKEARWRKPLNLRRRAHCLMLQSSTKTSTCNLIILCERLTWQRSFACPN